jgi:hypothetical protein
MLVHEAVQQARRVKQYLHSIEPGRIELAQDRLSNLRWLMATTIAGQGLLRPSDSDYTIFQSYIQDIQAEVRSLGNALRTRGVFRELQDVSEPIRTWLQESNVTVLRLIDEIRNLEIPDFLSRPGNRSLLFQIDIIRDVIDLLERVDSERQRLDVFADAWLMLDSRRDDPSSSHSIDLRSTDGPMTIAQCISWLRFIDALLKVAAAESGSVSASEGIILERLETGSVFQSLKNVPPQVWERLSAMLSRITNPEGTTIENRLSQTEAILKMTEVIERTRKLEEEGRLKPHEAESIVVELMAVNDVPLRSGVAIIEMDGVPVGRLDIRDTPALRSPRILELPSGDADSDSTT